MKRPLLIASIFISLSLLIIQCGKDNDFWNPFIPETDDEPTSSQVNGYVFRPAVVDATAERVNQLKVPAGFQVKKFTENVGMPRILVTGPNNIIYVSDREAGVVMLLQDADGDGTAERKETVATLPQAHGLAIDGSTLYIITVKELYRATINANGTLTQPTMLLNNLPDGGQHPNRTIAIGPDGWLYISIGSTCNACPEPNPLNATMVRVRPDGTGMQTFAKGLRNTIGFDWHPETGKLWGMDHGIDWLGDNEQQEELNLLKQGANYGWPYIYGNGKYNPADRPKGDTTYQQYAAMCTNPTTGYQAHAAPMQMIFYDQGMFPADYRGDAFITMRGSWNRSNPVGYSLVRVHFEGGKPTGFEDFLTGFLVNGNRAHFGRLVGLTIDAQGALLISDDTNGVIYRISRS
ncbi:MAG: PQQ-dependent sugar dehydrogenase [Chitinophagaceae bacterium]|nr:PQQ-dependent sugar dehydrogenase [Chitinophagaceae bacterium]